MPLGTFYARDWAGHSSGPQLWGSQLDSRQRPQKTQTKAGEGSEDESSAYLDAQELGAGWHPDEGRPAGRGDHELGELHGPQLLRLPLPLFGVSRAQAH